MPNYVKNIVKAEGICRLPLFSEENGKRYFDFNKIIPMPESLNVDAGSVTDSAIVYYLTEKCTISIPCLSEERKEILRQTVSNLFHRGDLRWAQEIFTRVSVDMFLKNEMAKEEMCSKGKLYIDNFQKYGHTTWYEWRIANWDTKWNACDSKLQNDNAITFETAWSAPEKVIRKLAEMYPDLMIEHWWADEDIGNNTGHTVYKNGSMAYGGYYENESEDAYETYILCWGESNCIYRDDEGQWKRHDCDTCHGCD